MKMNILRYIASMNVLQLLLYICLYTLFYVLYLGFSSDRQILIITRTSLYAVLNSSNIYINPENVVRNVDKSNHEPAELDSVSYVIRDSMKNARRVNAGHTKLPRTSLTPISALEGYKSILQTYLDNLNVARKEILKTLLSDGFSWSFAKQSVLKVIYAGQSNYLRSMSQYNFIKTLLLEVPYSKLLTISRQVYGYGSNDCEFIKLHSTGRKYPTQDSVPLYSVECQEMGSMKPITKQLPSKVFSAINVLKKPIHDFMSKSHQIMTVAYIHIVRNAIVNRHGDIFVKNLKIVPIRCQPNLISRRLPSRYLSQIPIFDEVFTIAQFWGEGYYHALAEELTRMAPYLDFLRQHPEIKIHVVSIPKFIPDFLKRLDLNPARLVKGPVRARILYAPNGMDCGNPNTFSLQLLSSVLKNSSASNGQAERQEFGDVKIKHRKHSNQERKKNIILIKRQTKRKFNHHKEIYTMLARTAIKNQLKLQVFADDKIPELNETIQLFGNAEIIVAPHGAGLTNMLFSQPGTMIIEALCFNTGIVASRKKKSLPFSLKRTFLPLKKTGKQSKVDFNLCYRNIAHILGHQYYGIIAEDTHCNETRAAHVQSILLHYLRHRINPN